MLVEPSRELLTAYADGELSAHERQTVQRLLDRSPEAREYLRLIEADADRLRNLPRRRLDPNFSSRVLSAIRARNLRPGRLRPVQPAPATLPAWIGLASAAAVLLLVTATSYVIFAQRAVPDGPADGGFAQRNLPAEASQGGSTEPERPAGKALASNDTRRERPEPKPTEPVRTAAETPRRAPSPDPAPETVVTSPIPRMELFKPVKVPEVALPVVFKMEKLDPAVMRAELDKDTGFRLELPVQESVKAFERLRTAFKTGGPGLAIDPNAQFRLEHPQLKTHFIVYTEALTPDDLVRLLGQVGVEDRKAEAKKHGDGQFDSLVLTRLSKNDYKELSDLIGVDLQKPPAQRSSAPLGVDPRKPVSEGTADQVTEMLRNGKTTTRTPERLALVLPYNPVRPRPNSPEMKRFLESLRHPLPGGIQLLLVLREMKG